MPHSSGTGLAHNSTRLVSDGAGEEAIAIDCYTTSEPVLRCYLACYYIYTPPSTRPGRPVEPRPVCGVCAKSITLSGNHVFQAEAGSWSNGIWQATPR